ncbi:hypothetical protein [Glaciimonas immobilis]|uniref:Uncharacterized protein n=1 Tax=Glaciimonas immobilis TaxID=728004 RepID=A0A840RX42_9BURK|nr:hypothetical protein [Glaciimonas immobilis]KAF3998580.1 hypothetical protein HAV38_06925 [Glaciimonas immobilis]MBB5201436.1 hypothetical protein [Glaciimonas immobilis]
MLILFLTFLLPLQVFAGGIDAHIKIAHQAQNNVAFSQAHQILESAHQVAQQAHLFDIADIADMITDQSGFDDCCAFGDDPADSSLHADLSDEPVPAHGFTFPPKQSSLALAHSDDKKREPPYLPLVPPPPRA